MHTFLKKYKCRLIANRFLLNIRPCPPFPLYIQLIIFRWLAGWSRSCDPYKQQSSYGDILHLLTHDWLTLWRMRIMINRVYTRERSMTVKLPFCISWKSIWVFLEMRCWGFFGFFFILSLVLSYHGFFFLDDTNTFSLLHKAWAICEWFPVVKQRVNWTFSPVVFSGNLWCESRLAFLKNIGLRLWVLSTLFRQCRILMY